MINNLDEATCCGCEVCVHVCPKKCITMNEGTLGARIAVASYDHCIQCGKCESYCPIRQLEHSQDNLKKQVYAGYCKNSDMRNRGASGGIAPLIAQRLFDVGYEVYGAAFDESNHLRHICAKNQEDLLKIAKSKYLQSTMTAVYASIHQKLKDGDSVLFIGTPCQNAAIHRYIPSQYHSKMVLVDFFCHGVPSQRFFDECLAYEDNVMGVITTAYKFRSKPKRAVSPHYFTKVYKNSKGKEKTVTKLYFNSLFYAAFQKYITLRESCYNCKFSSSERVSDITVGDFHEIDNYISGINRFDGVSRIIINTDKGREVFDMIRDALWIHELDMGELQRNGHGFGEPNARPKDRDKFVALYEHEGIKGLADTFLNHKHYRVNNIYYHFPKAVRKMLMRVIGGEK